MSFLTPAFLFGALAVAVPIVLHFLPRERLPRVPFSDLRLLRRALVEQTRRQRLRELRLLALRVAALLLLALAFARPFVADRTSGEGATVVLVDTSFSVSAPGQAAEARALAHAAIDAAPAGQLVGVVAFDDAARVAAPLALARAAAHAAVDGLQPRPRGTRYRDGLAAASALIGDRPGRVVVVTDLQAGGWDAGSGAPAPHVEVETRRVAAPDGNLAVVGIDREPSQIAVRLSRWGAPGGDSRLTIEVDGRVVDESVQRVAPGESTVRRPVALPAVGVVTVAVSDAAGYPADDRRYRRLDPSAAAGVLLVTGDRRRREVYLERALSPGGAVGGFALTTVAAADLGRRPEPLAAAEVVVLAGTRGLGRSGRERLSAFVRGGGGLLAVGGPAAGAAAEAGLLGAGAGAGATRTHAEPVALAPADRRHPVVRALGELAGRLGRARFVRTAGLGAAGAPVLSFSDGAPALVEHSAGTGRILVFGADLRNDGNDLPRQPVFAPFVHETVGYLAARRPSPREFVVGEAPPGAPGRPGPARLPGAAGTIVLNVDNRESAFVPLTDGEFQAAVDRVAEPEAGETASSRRAAPRREAAEQSLWRYLLIGMALALVAEGLLAGRAP